MEIDFTKLIIESALGTLIALVTTSSSAGIVWLLFVGRRTRALKALLDSEKRIFRLHYRADDSLTKEMRFLKNGLISTKENFNENSWEVRFGHLKIYDEKRNIYSKFKWDKKLGQLLHVNDPRLPSVMGQYIIPLYRESDYFP